MCRWVRQTKAELWKDLHLGSPPVRCRRSDGRNEEGEDQTSAIEPYFCVSQIMHYPVAKAVVQVRRFCV
jgi:hypothetical protein